ncbi:hypothetical protein E3E11_05700 [Oecophyllibacter saccharovorans]|uniref:glycosyltransferase family 2 protein n=1 Tax=Oecophyllibacter saccharovorans TaxID=2558360 RepID=UPI00114430E6|nr:glycosyltransferase family 2 protein [Oecophyllibacter saccharovorans]QDH15426.1 hypothetical protein E3E11_05700 [Oecophyllibacter saccharovorans]
MCASPAGSLSPEVSEAAQDPGLPDPSRQHPPTLKCAVLARNAADLLPSWLGWHLALGATEIIVVSGNTADDVLSDAPQADAILAMADCLAKAGWPVRAVNAGTLPDEPEARRVALTRAAVTALTEERPGERPDNTWGLVLDTDEYLAPETDLKHLLALAAQQAETAFPLNWRQFICTPDAAGEIEARQTGWLAAPPVALHEKRFPDSHPDHGFQRFMRPLATLEAKDITDLATTATLGLRPDNNVSAGGYDLPRWQGGSLLHYPRIIFPDSSEADADPLLAAFAAAERAHYTCAGVTDRTAHSFLEAMRHKRDALLQTLWQAGKTQLASLAARFADLERKERLEAEERQDGLLARILQQRLHKEGFRCQPVRPGQEARQLLTSAVSPPFDPVEVIRPTSAEKGRFPAGPVLGMRTAAQPCVIAFTAPEAEQSFICGDVPVIEGWAVMRLSPQQAALAVTSANLESPLSEGLSLPELVSLPSPDWPGEAQAPRTDASYMKKETFLRWLNAHPWTTSLDIRRALLCLAPPDAAALARAVPALRPFLTPSS